MPMPLPRRATALLIATLLLPAAWASASPEEAQTWFFEGLDLKEAGDCEGAVARFQKAVAENPGLHQARLYLAECYLELGLPDAAAREIGLYLDADFPGAEVDRACEMLNQADGHHRACKKGRRGGGGGTVTLPPEASWAPVTVEGGLLVHHFDNQLAVTAAGPAFAGRVLVWRFVELRGQFGLGFAPYPGQAGRIEIPVFGIGAAFSAPLGPMRLFAGIVVPWAISRLGLEMRADGGIMGEGGVRVALPGSRVVVGGQMGGGYLVSPVFAGSVHVGVQLGPRSGGR